MLIKVRVYFIISISLLVDLFSLLMEVSSHSLIFSMLAMPKIAFIFPDGRGLFDSVLSFNEGFKLSLGKRGIDRALFFWLDLLAHSQC